MKNFKQFILKKNHTIDSCIKKLGKNIDLNYPQGKIVIIVDDYNKVIGTVTDGDIRRALIRKVTVKEKITKIMNQNPKLIHKDSLKKDIKKYNNFNFPIPVVDKKGIITDIYTNSNQLISENKSNTIILMAGGFGKRLKPMTDNTPKPMIKIVDKPILELIINNFKKFGFTNF